MTVTDPSTRRRWPGRVLVTLAAIVGVPSLVTVVIGIGTLFPAQSNPYTFFSSYFWTTVAPFLVLVGVVALVVALAAFFRGHRRVGGVVAIVALAGTVWSSVVSISIVHAADQAGGAVDPVAALAPGSMNAASDSRVVYETVGGQALHASVYRPKASSGDAPVIMYIHGGGWINGSDTQFGHDMRWYADRGYLVVSVDYRLATTTHATWDEAPEDVACALVWTQDHAAALGGDPSRLVVSGDSAGGNLAVNLAYSAALGRATSDCGGTVPVPKAVVTQYPVVNPQNAYDTGYPAPAFEPKTFTDDYLGGTPASHPDRMKAISSSTYVSPKAPPTLVIEPQHDGLIPTAGVESWIASARKAGAPVTTAPVPFANHTFNQAAAGTLGNQAALTMTTAYLHRIGLAP
jgi:acetyl esterase/lipase